jgi:predicted Zn-dependent peptidase
VPVVLDSDLSLASFTVCVLLPLSARDEAIEERGISHLLEHLVMSAPGAGGRPFGDWVSEVGGEANASTELGHVSYWARVPPAAAAECARRLAAAVSRPALTPELVASERKVVVQELLGAAVDPVDQSTERFFAALFPGQPLGAPVGGGTPFPDFGLDQLTARQERGVAAGAAVALVGAPAQLAAAVAELGDSGLVRAAAAPARAPVAPPPAVVDLAVPAEAGYAYLTIGGLGAARRDPLWAAGEVLAAAVGGLPGSLLYRRLRGELGLSYQVFARTTALSDLGVWRVLVGTPPGDVPRAAKVVRECLAEAAGGLPAPVLAAARTQALGAVLIDNEDPVARAHLDAGHAVEGMVTQVPVVAARQLLTAVAAADVAAAARRVLDSYTGVVAAA